MRQTLIERGCFALAAVIFLLAMYVMLTNQDSVIGIALLIVAALCARVLVIDIPGRFDAMNGESDSDPDESPSRAE